MSLKQQHKHTFNGYNMFSPHRKKQNAPNKQMVGFLGSSLARAAVTLAAPAATVQTDAAPNDDF
jgi:hypothetical protein